ncbi:hypothetical protein EDD17DRAFT_1901214 [Pisolithus thermaeus]|nr:hypothetical protein EDD17DRAFT_1901214 [Pisolithus thermaeus]
MTTTTPLLITVHNTYNKVKEQRLNPSYCRVTPQSDEMRHLIDAFNCVEGCPIFAEVYDCCRIYADASLAGARKPRSGACDTAINWSVDLHHAKRGEASGFCYVNSIVLAILELLRKLDDNGASLGTHFCSNVPLRDGIDDEMYVTVFKTVIEDMVTAYRPTAVVLQCGADSLGRDRLGAFNLSIVAHGECVNFVPKFNVPLLVQGGGALLAQRYRTNRLPRVAIQEIPPGLEGLLADGDQNHEGRMKSGGPGSQGQTGATGGSLGMGISKAITTSTRTTVRRGRASGVHGREDGEEVDEPGGPRRRSLGRRGVETMCGDMDADVGVYPACNLHESASLLLLDKLRREPLGVGLE